MKGILNLLAKVNLVELSDEEKVEAGLLSPEEPADYVPAPVQTETPPVLDLPPPSDPAQDQRPLEDIYSAAKVPSSPFPAEKLLKLLDGLRAMDSATRKSAVMAMDAADDNWQISDCTADAERKIAALNAYKQYLSTRVSSVEKQSVEKIGESRAALELATLEIRKQISELEQLLEREITKAAQLTTSIEGAARNEREAAGKETRRIDGEIERLNEILLQFTTVK